MIDLFDIVRLVNTALLLSLVVGLVAGWWRARHEPPQPLGIAAFAFAIALLYGHLEAIVQDAPPSTRPIVMLAAISIANVCVYIPLLIPRKDPR